MLAAAIVGFGACGVVSTAPSLANVKRHHAPPTLISNANAVAVKEPI